MNWAAIVGRISGTVDRHLLDRNAYLLAENRVYRDLFEGTPPPRLTDAHRISLAKAAKPLGRTFLAELATIVTPDTLLHWHRKLVEKVRPAEPARVGPGRPPTDDSTVQLVLRLARENPSWGYDRVAGALAELGHAISDTTVGNILREHAEHPAPARKRGTSWSDFIAAHKDLLLGCDFFTKVVWTLTGPVTCYVLFFIHVASRKVYVAGITTNPNEPWMRQVARNITMADIGFAHDMKYLILDRDARHCESFRATLESAGIRCLRLPPRSPNLNAYAERFVRSIKEECLDRLILFGQGSLARAVDQYIEHYHTERPHQGIGNIILFPSNSPEADPPESAGPVLCRKRLGGLLKYYHRAA